MPYTGIVLAILALHLAGFLVLLGHWVAGAGMFPRATEKFAAEYERRPLRAVLLGVFTYGPMILLLLNAAKIPNEGLRLLVVIASIFTLLIALFGSADLALRIGRNLSPEADPWRQSLRGGVVLALVFITPFLGSVFLLHVGLASGFGVFLLSRSWRRKAAAPSPVPAPIEPAPAAAEPALS